MKIYNINSVNFMAKKTFPNKKVCNVIKETKTVTTDLFYSDIEKFLNKKCTKEEYLKSFMENFEKNNYNLKNSMVEQKYVNDLLTSIDLVNNYKEIPENYITERMLNLLKNKNKS